MDPAKRNKKHRQLEERDAFGLFVVKEEIL